MNPESIQQRLAVLAPLKDADGQPLLAAVLSAYADTCRKGLDDMGRALASADFSTLKRRAHTLGGAAGTLGMQEIFERCKQLQAQAQEEEAELCSRSLTELIAACKEADGLLEQVSRRLESAGLSESGKG